MDKQELIERIEDLILANSDDPRKQLDAIATAWLEDRESLLAANRLAGAYIKRGLAVLTNEGEDE